MFQIFSIYLADAGEDLNGLPGYDITVQSLFGILTGLACWATRLALIAVVLALVWYGLQFILSQGNPTKFAGAKKSFWYGILGVVVIMATYTIIATIANAFGADYTLFLPLDCSAY
ncbi:hypothetical protein KW791_01290 [Candidatus Parcubacteria bacterium]|nr:hypothetical protein [Candidatus Parcubacteria bacterium]